MNFSIQKDVLELYTVLFGDKRRFNVVEYNKESGLPDAFEFSPCTILYTSDAIVSVERGMPYQLRYQIGYRGRPESCMAIIESVRSLLRRRERIDPLIEKDTIPNVCETLFKLVDQRRVDRRYTNLGKKKNSRIYQCTLSHEDKSIHYISYNKISSHLTNKHSEDKTQILDKIRTLLKCDHPINGELKWKHFNDCHRKTPVKELYLIPFMTSICGLCGQTLNKDPNLENRESAIQRHIETVHSTYIVSSNPTPSESGPSPLFEQWLDAPSKEKRMNLISAKTSADINLLKCFLFM